MTERIGLSVRGVPTPLWACEWVSLTDLWVYHVKIVAAATPEKAEAIAAASSEAGHESDGFWDIRPAVEADIPRAVFA